MGMTDYRFHEHKIRSRSMSTNSLPATLHLEVSKIQYILSSYLFHKLYSISYS